MEIIKKPIRGFIKGAILLYLKIVYRLKVVGKENVPKKGALIFCGNHRSLLNAPIIVSSAPRHMRFFAKKELYYKVLGFLFWNNICKKRCKRYPITKRFIESFKEW